MQAVKTSPFAVTFPASGDFYLVQGILKVIKTNHRGPGTPTLFQ